MTQIVNVMIQKIIFLKWDLKFRETQLLTSQIYKNSIQKKEKETT